MTTNRKWIFGLSSLIAGWSGGAMSADAQSIRMVSVEGAVQVNGKPATMGQVLKSAERVETGKTGVAILQSGSDNVVKIASGSKLEILQSSNGLSIKLEAGRIEGVNRVSDGPKQNAQVSTANASLDIPGGRYIVQVDEKSEQFYSMDLPAPLTQSNGSTEKVTTISAGQGMAVSSVPVESAGRAPASGSAPVVIPPPVPLTPPQKFEIASVVQLQPIAQKPTSGFQSIAVDPVLGTSPSVNRDPVQSVGRANVSVEFRY